MGWRRRLESEGQDSAPEGGRDTPRLSKAIMKIRPDYRTIYGLLVWPEQRSSKWATGPLPLLLSYAAGIVFLSSKPYQYFIMHWEQRE